MGVACVGALCFRVGCDRDCVVAAVVAWLLHMLICWFEASFIYLEIAFELPRGTWTDHHRIAHRASSVMSYSVSSYQPIAISPPPHSRRHRPSDPTHAHRRDLT